MKSSLDSSLNINNRDRNCDNINNQRNIKTSNDVDDDQSSMTLRRNGETCDDGQGSTNYKLSPSRSSEIIESSSMNMNSATNKTAVACHECLSIPTRPLTIVSPTSSPRRSRRNKTNQCNIYRMCASPDECSPLGSIRVRSHSSEKGVTSQNRHEQARLIVRSSPVPDLTVTLMRSDSSSSNLVPQCPGAGSPAEPSFGPSPIEPLGSLLVAPNDGNCITRTFSATEIGQRRHSKIGQGSMVGCGASRRHGSSASSGQGGHHYRFSFWDSLAASSSNEGVKTSLSPSSVHAASLSLASPMVTQHTQSTNIIKSSLDFVSSTTILSEKSSTSSPPRATLDFVPTSVAQRISSQVLVSSRGKR